jgi:hypothetical protein
MTKIESNVHIVVTISYSFPQRFVLLMVRRPTDTNRGLDVVGPQSSVVRS